MLMNPSILDPLIADKQRSVRVYVVFGAIIVSLGIAIVAGALVLKIRLPEEGFRTVLGLGAGFVSSMGLFPLKEVLALREKIVGLETLKEHIRGLSGQSDLEEVRRIEDLIWKIIENSVG